MRTRRQSWLVGTLAVAVVALALVPLVFREHVWRAWHVRRAVSVLRERGAFPEWLPFERAAARFLSSEYPDDVRAQAAYQLATIRRKDTVFDLEANKPSAGELAVLFEACILSFGGGESAEGLLAEIDRRWGADERLGEDELRSYELGIDEYSGWFGGASDPGAGFHAPLELLIRLVVASGRRDVLDELVELSARHRRLDVEIIRTIFTGFVAVSEPEFQTWWEGGGRSKLVWNERDRVFVAPRDEMFLIAIDIATRISDTR